MTCHAHGVGQVAPILLEHHQRVHRPLQFALQGSTCCLLQWQPGQVQQTVGDVGHAGDATADQVAGPQHQQGIGSEGPGVVKVAPELGPGLAVGGNGHQRLGQGVSSGCSLGRHLATVDGFGQFGIQLVGQGFLDGLGLFGLQLGPDLGFDVDLLANRCSSR